MDNTLECYAIKILKIHLKIILIVNLNKNKVHKKANIHAINVMLGISISTEAMIFRCGF